MSPLTLWSLIAGVALAGTGWRLALKYAVGDGVGLSPESVLLLTATSWFLAAIILAGARHGTFVQAVCDDAANIKTRWTGVAAIAAVSVPFAVFAYVFYHLARDNQACTLFPVRSAIVLVLTVAGSMLLFKEKLRRLQAVALALFGLGVAAMVADSFGRSAAGNI